MTTSTDSSPPLLHISEGVARITLNRPAQRNRLENADLATLLQQFEQINTDETVRVLVLTANTSTNSATSASALYSTRLSVRFKSGFRTIVLPS